LALPDSAAVADAIQAMRENPDLVDTLHTIFLVDDSGTLRGSVPVSRLFLHEGSTPLASLAFETRVEVPVTESQDRVTELFDKYNLLALPVVDEEGKLAGVITVDDIISVLRHR
jgi:magnesium transporter